MSRKYTNILIDMAEEGLIDWQDLAKKALGYMFESEVQDMAEYNGWIDSDETIDLEDIDFEMVIEYDPDPDVSYLEPGMLDDPEDEKANAERLAAYYRQEWHMLGIMVRATWTDSGGEEQTRDSGGLWCIESDMGQDYFNEVYEEEKAELIKELRNEGVID